MKKKTFTYRGKTLEELQELSDDEFAKLVPSRARRSLQRPATQQHKILLKNLENSNDVKTHVRDLVITPKMVGKTIRIYSGKEFVPITVTDEMIGHFLGEFSITRRRVGHNAPGVGATRSSAAISVR